MAGYDAPQGIDHADTSYEPEGATSAFWRAWPRDSGGEDSYSPHVDVCRVFVLVEGTPQLYSVLRFEDADE